MRVIQSLSDTYLSDPNFVLFIKILLVLGAFLLTFGFLWSACLSYPSIRKRLLFPLFSSEWTDYQQTPKDDVLIEVIGTPRFGLDKAIIANDALSDINGDEILTPLNLLQ
jgi:hypothetical protein